MADKTQYILSFQFQLHRNLARAGDLPFREEIQTRAEGRAASDRALHARLPRPDLAREHADRGLMVLFV